jgi:hypothetical protein
MKTRIAAAAVLLSALASLVSAGATGGNPRFAALAKAQRLYDAGRYEKALPATEVAEASALPDPLVIAEALVLRNRFLEALGQEQPAEANHDYVGDQDPSSERVAQARASLLRLAVDIAFLENEDGQATQIHFVSAPHPLLGSTDRSSLPALRQTKIHFELE